MIQSFIKYNIIKSKYYDNLSTSKFTKMQNICNILISKTVFQYSKKVFQQRKRASIAY